MGGATIFSRASYQFRRRQDGRHAAFGFGDGIDEMHDSLAQGRQRDAVGQFDGLGKTAIPTIQLRNRTGISSRPPKIGSASHIADCYFCF